MVPVVVAVKEVVTVNALADVKVAEELVAVVVTAVLIDAYTLRRACCCGGDDAPSFSSIIF